MTGTRAAETAARKERLVAAATALAAEGGYDAVQMRDVAARAEVALGTLYRHYASKDQLLLAAMAQQAATLRERLVQRPPSGRHVRPTRVSDVLRRTSRSLERSPLVTKAMLTAMSTSEEAAAPLKHEIDSTLRAIIADVVDGDGQCDTVADLDGIVRVLGSVWFAELTYWSNGLNPSSSMGDNLASAARTAARLSRARADQPAGAAFRSSRTSPTTAAFSGLLESTGPTMTQLAPTSAYGRSRSASAAAPSSARTGQPAPRERRRRARPRARARRRPRTRSGSAPRVPAVGDRDDLADLRRAAPDPHRDSRCRRRRAHCRAARSTRSTIDPKLETERLVLRSALRVARRRSPRSAGPRSRGAR